MNRNVVTFIGCDKEYKESKLVLFGAPFDSTTSYRPGTRFASSAIRQESFGIESYSPYQDKDLEDAMVFDGGDLDLIFGNSQASLQAIEEFTEEVAKDNKIPFMIGGEHLVTLGSIRALSKIYPELHILHFDAHADLREDYLGEQLSHATVMKRNWEILGDNRIYQYGIRSGDKSEFEFAKAGHTFMNKFNLNGFEETIKKLNGKPVYVSLDLDILDPSIFPGTGTPEPGGVSFNELLQALTSLTNLNVVGMDINELSPVYDQSGVSTIVACKLIREMILSVV